MRFLGVREGVTPLRREAVGSSTGIPVSDLFVSPCSTFSYANTAFCELPESTDPGLKKTNLRYSSLVRQEEVGGCWKSIH